MTEERIATVRPVAEHEARGAVAESLPTSTPKNIDFVPAIWRTLAANPTQLEVVWSSLKNLMHPEAAGTSPGSIPEPARSSPWPSPPPTAALTASTPTPPPSKQGVDQDTLGEIMAIVGLFNMTNALANGYQIEPDILPPLD